jgi:LysM repeat protein
MSSRSPRRARRGATSSRSAWVYIAPAALLIAVTAIMMILSGTGVLGHTGDGGQPPSNSPAGPVQTLSVPQTTPPPEPPTTAVTPLPVTTPKTTAVKTKTATTTADTTAATTSEPTTATTATTTTTTSGSSTDTTSTPDTTTTPSTGDGGQHVKWTVKNGDTLSSIATQFETSVRELERLNPSIDPAALQVGQEIVVR